MTANGPWGTINYAYDNVGNRLSETTSTGMTEYAYMANRVMSSNGEKVMAFVYDNNGNTVTETTSDTTSYIYNQNQRIKRTIKNSVIVGEYVYNGKGQRVKKITPTETVIYHYDLEGRLLAESTGAGAMLADYVYINGIPFAKINGTAINFYHADHLGSPQKMTNSSGDIVWDGEFLPFGEPFSISGAITNNLRFPGQYFDSETGLHQNYFRDYDPKTGRYIEADPAGLLGGMNLYTYVQNNPLTNIDPKGLRSLCTYCDYEGMRRCLTNNAYGVSKAATECANCIATLVESGGKVWLPSCNGCASLMSEAYKCIESNCDTYHVIFEGNKNLKYSTNVCQCAKGKKGYILCGSNAYGKSLYKCIDITNDDCGCK